MGSMHDLNDMIIQRHQRSSSSSWIQFVMEEPRDNFPSLLLAQLRGFDILHSGLLFNFFISQNTDDGVYIEPTFPHNRRRILPPIKQSSGSAVWNVFAFGCSKRGEPKRKKKTEEPKHHGGADVITSARTEAIHLPQWSSRPRADVWSDHLFSSPTALIPARTSIYSVKSHISFS